MRKAMEFLTDEWLVDVAADYAGKCHADRRCALHYRTLAVAGSARVLRHRRTPRRRQDHEPHMLIMASPASGQPPPPGRRTKRSGARRCCRISSTALPIFSGTTSRAGRRFPARISRSPAPPRTTPTASSASPRWSRPRLRRSIFHRQQYRTARRPRLAQPARAPRRG